MSSTLDLLKCDTDRVLARQGEEADRLFVLQHGVISGKLVPQADRSDDSAIIAANAVEEWKDDATIVGAESVLCGHYIESLVSSPSSDVLVVPINRVELIKQFASAPKMGLAFGRTLARKVMNANDGLSASQHSVTRLEQELQRYYSEFYNIVKGIDAEAEGEPDILDALKAAKTCKTYSTGQNLQGDAEDSTVQMTRVIEAYEMTGKQHKVKKGEALCRAGDPGNSMFIVTKGKLSVVINDDAVGVIGAGETVGEIAVLLGQDSERTADLIALETTVVGIIPGDQFEALACAQPVMLIQILNQLVKRVEANYAVIADSASREKTSVTRYLAKPGVDLVKDYRELASKIDRLIEEFDLPLYREFDLLERGAEKIDKMKSRYADWLPQASE